MNDRVQLPAEAMLKECDFLEDAEKDSLAYNRTKNLIIENLKFQGIE